MGGAKQTLLIHYNPKRINCRMRAPKAAIREQYPNVRIGQVGEEALL